MVWVMLTYKAMECGKTSSKHSRRTDKEPPVAPITCNKNTACICQFKMSFG